MSGGFTKEMMFPQGQQLADSQTVEIRSQPTSGAVSYNQPGSSIIFRLERQPQTFLENSTLLINGRVTFTLATPNTNVGQLLGYGMSLFSMLRVRSNGVAIDEIQNPGQLTAKLYDMILTRSDKVALSSALLFDPITATQGVIFNTSNTTNGAGRLHNGMNSTVSFSFSLPILCSVTNAGSFFPIFASDLEIELVLAPVSSCIASLVGDARTTTYSLDRMEMLCSTLKLEAEPFARLMREQVLNDGYLTIKSDTWGYFSTTIPAAQNAGRLDMNYPVQVKSLKRLLFTTTPADCADGTYGGVNPNLESFQLVAGSDAYPRLPLRVNNPGEVFMNNQKSFGAIYSTAHCGSIHPRAFARASTAYSTYGAYNTLTGVLAGISAAIDTSAGANNDILNLTSDFQPRNNKFAILCDFEAISGNKELLFSGINTRGVTSFLRLNIEATLSASVHTVHVWENHDVVIRIDPINLQTVVDY